MYAVIVTGGKQYQVSVGDTLKVELLEQKEGEIVELDKVLLLADGDQVEVGNPYVPQAKVLVEIVSCGRQQKVEITKFRRRKHHMKHQGHRQHYTEIRVKEIKKN